MSDVQIKSGDVLPVVRYQLARNGEPVDLSTASSVLFVMRQFTATTPKVSAAATVVDAVSGIVQYAWQPSDIDTPGLYDASWIVNFPGSRQTFPTDDYLEVEVQLDLTRTGALVPLRPTDGVRPPVSAIGAMLATRGRNTVTGTQFGPGSTPTYQQVAQIIDNVAGELDGYLHGVPLTPSLARTARLAISYAAAATVELTFWPEQATSGSSPGGIWWQRYQTLLTQLTKDIEAAGGGPAEYGAIPVTSPTLVAYNQVISTGAWSPIGFGVPW